MIRSLRNFLINYWRVLMGRPLLGETPKPHPSATATEWRRYAFENLPACGQCDEWGRKPTDPNYGEPQP